MTTPEKTNTPTNLAIMSLEGKEQGRKILEFISTIKLYEIPDESTIFATIKPLLVELAEAGSCLYRADEINEIDCMYIFDIYRDLFYSSLVKR